MPSTADKRFQRLTLLPFEPVGSVQGNAFGGFIGAIREAWSRKELLALLVRRELKARYKDSSLGFVWSLIRPLVMLLIYYFAIGKVLGAERGIPQFGIFVFTGLTLWGLYSEIVSGGTMSILSNAGLIKKVYLPREIFPLAATGSAFFNFVMQMAILLAATVLVGQFPWHQGLVYGLGAIIVIILFGTALGLFFSAANVYLRDVQYLVEVGLLILFWASPIVYSFDLVREAVLEAGLGSWVLELYLTNPITVAIISFQKAIWITGADSGVVYPDHLGLRLLIMGLVSLLLIWIAQRIFSKLQGNFAQEI